MHLRTAREEILNAFVSLERRHGRKDFALAEVLAEAQTQGTVHLESTLRTHIASAMCINAPPHHAVRHDDLERIARGRYRRL
jgi:hypothetical protein